MPAHARAAAGGGSGRPSMSSNSGSGSGSGLGSGSLLFEPGYAEHTRSAIRIRTAPRNSCQSTAADSWAVAAVETNCCNNTPILSIKTHQ